MVEEKKWVKIKCHACSNEQVIFGRAATEVKCTSCGAIVAVPTGGKAAIRDAEIIELI